MSNANLGNVVGFGAITPVLDRWKQGIADAPKVTGRGFTRS
jgi:hypothetical protein